MRIFSFISLACFYCLIHGCTLREAEKDLLVNLFDPFIATRGNNGQLYPGATTPFGLVKLSPETTGKGHSGYQCQGTGYKYFF